MNLKMRKGESEMKSMSLKTFALAGLLAVALVTPNLAPAGSFEQIVVFGTSLSDPGNAFYLKKTVSADEVQLTPPYDTLDQLLIPGSPYAKGGHHFSNGATWIEQLARPLGLAGSVRPAFVGSGNNYAVGGARAYEDGVNVNLPYQVNAFLDKSGGVAPSDALYVVEFGSNDIRDAFENPAVLTAALVSIRDNIILLHGKGARMFLVCNAPDIGLTPAILSLGPGASAAATALTIAFNAGLDGLTAALAGLPGIEMAKLDVYGLLHDIVAYPGSFDLTVVDTACVTPNVPPFKCKKPDEYLFWDGIHPTRAGHAIFAEGAASVLLP
ncbi:MAG: SGNH/GDSL hydrolase family protein [Syntrophaceae bacterium]